MTNTESIMDIPELHAHIKKLRMSSTINPKKILIINTSSMQHCHAAMGIIKNEFPEAQTSIFSNSGLEEIGKDAGIHAFYSSRGHIKEGQRKYIKGSLFTLRKAQFNVVLILKSYTGGLQSKIARLLTQAFALAMGADIIIVSERQGGVTRLSLPRVFLKTVANILFPIIYIFQMPINFVLSGLLAIVFLFAIIILFLNTRVRTLLKT